MQNPYQALGLESSAGEAAVRARYLELVRQHPPDRDPQRFAEIRKAYEDLRDPVRLMAQRLFDYRSHDTIEGIVTELEDRVRNTRLPTATLLSLGDSLLRDEA